MPTGRIEQQIDLKVTGLKDVKDAEKVVAGLDGKSAKVTIAADAKAAQKTVADVLKDVEKLDGQDAQIVLAIRAAAVQQELTSILGDLAQVDGADAEVEVKLDRAAELRGDLDQLEGAIKDLDGTSATVEVKADTEPVKRGLVETKEQVGEVGKSADGAGSALANMVGNSAQDLGSLGGVAGSAGVAIGQMAEYMADARLAGEGMGSVLKSFGTVALPIAALSLVSGVISSIVESGKKMGEAIKASTQEAIDAFIKVQDEGKTTVGVLDDLATTDVDKAFKDMGASADDTVDRLKTLGISYDDIVEAFRSGTGPLAESIDKYQQMQDLFDRLTTVAGATADPFEQVGHAFGMSADEAEAFLKTMGPVNDALGSHVTVSLEAGKAAQSFAKYRGQSGEVAEKAGEQEAKAGEKATKSLEEQRQAAEDLAAQMADWAVKVLDANRALDDMTSTFGHMSIDEDSLTRVFDIHDAPAKAAAGVRDIEESIGGLKDALSGIKVDDVLAGNFKADKFLDAIDKLGPQVQAKVVDAFSTGGPEAATAMANSYIDQVTASLGGKFTREQVATMLGLDDITATIKAAVDQSTLTRAKKELELLTGIGGETPWTASVALALETGQITPEEAERQILEKLQGLGVDIPASLLPPDTQPATEAVDGWAQHAESLAPEGTFGANPAPAEAAVQDWMVGADSTTATATLGANQRPATQELDGWANAVKGTTATGTLDANRSPADAKAQGVRSDVVNTPATMLLATVPSNLDGVRTVFRNVANSVPNADINAVAHTGQAETDLNNVARNRTATVTVNVVGGLSEGGTAGPRGDFAGEAGPEFVELPDGRRLLVNGPTPVPAGTRVTSTRRTRAILARAGTHASPAPAGLGNVNITLQAGVIGSRFEVERAVRRATRDGIRLAGTR
jgi:hypothetical protein